jgi:integrase
MSSIATIGPKSDRKYRARWRTPDGKSRSRTFDRKIDAEQFLTTVESSKLTGAYVDRSAGLTTLTEYFDQWLPTRRTKKGELLRPKTAALYRHLYDLHIGPTLGRSKLRDITPVKVRHWHGSLPGQTLPAKCYRLLRAMLNTAVDDEVIARNPCKIDNGGVEYSPERPLPTGDEVWALADAVGDRWRALVLMSSFGGLRWGELVGLQRRDINLDAGTVRVDRQVVEVNSKLVEGPPKTAAGVRTVSLPMVLIPELRAHLAQFTAADASSRVFVGPKGSTPRAPHFGDIWRKARKTVGRDDLHFHDCRHFANTLAAAAGASTKELMARLGHASPAAALRYQHATLERDRVIAERMSEMISSAAVSDPCHGVSDLRPLRALPGH